MSQPKIKLVKFLYNNWYGSMKVSNLCHDKYKELYNEKLNEVDDIEFDRTNEKVLNVINLIGINQCRIFPSNGIAIEYIPEELEEYVDIDEYDGKETISINYNLAFSEILHTIMNNYSEGEPTSLDESEYIKYSRIKYNRIKYIRVMMLSHDLKDKDNIDPTIFIV